LADPDTQGTPPSDAALVARALTGDQKAQEMLFLRHVRMVSGLIFRVHPVRSELDDLVQDTFIAAFESLARLTNPQAFAAWIGSIAIRTTHKRVRRHRIATRLGLVRKEEIAWNEIVSPECPADVRLELAQLYAAVAQFPTKERVALLLRRVEGMSLDEIAASTGESLATVKRRIVAAEAKLQTFRASS
jgi:RNA polymerase sigma-70 factor (ECF subfamily)